MAQTTVAFQAPSRLVALDLAHRLRVRGWTVEVGRPAHSRDGRIVRVTVPPTLRDELERIAASTSPDVVEVPEV
ncbi:MAG TPA: hypothetical protein VFV40_10270 [Nocardioides sp.]|nr:hypothetical protein [Nocardioides sp.]